jgi:hypothetical protein
MAAMEMINGAAKGCFLVYNQQAPTFRKKGKVYLNLSPTIDGCLLHLLTHKIPCGLYKATPTLHHFYLQPPNI